MSQVIADGPLPLNKPGTGSGGIVSSHSGANPSRLENGHSESESGASLFGIGSPADGLSSAHSPRPQLENERETTEDCSRPLAIDLFTGLHGWAEGLVAEGWRVVGFDIENMCAQFGMARPKHVQLVLQDVLTIHGAQFKDAALIVASPPCQEFSYMAMPWSKAKEKARKLMTGEDDPKRLTALFDACFRIQREAIEAAGHHIPLVVENVRGAQKWVGRSRYHFGSFHLWGDVPALMPMMKTRNKVDGFRFDGSGRSFQSASVEHTKNNGGSWFNIGSPGQKEVNQNPVHEGVKVASAHGRRTCMGNGARFTSRDCGQEGVKQGGDWFNASQPSISRMSGSKSPARKAASAAIARIPEVLARHIAKVYYPCERAS